MFRIKIKKGNFQDKFLYTNTYVSIESPLKGECYEK